MCPKSPRQQLEKSNGVKWPMPCSSPRPSYRYYFNILQNLHSVHSLYISFMQGSYIHVHTYTHTYAINHPSSAASQPNSHGRFKLHRDPVSTNDTSSNITKPKAVNIPEQSASSPSPTLHSSNTHLPPITVWPAARSQQRPSTRYL